MNPLLPLEHHVPDAEPHVMPDGRLYIYGSYDLSGDQFYCSKVYHGFSTDNMQDWQHHGQSFCLADSHLPEWAVYLRQMRCTKMARIIWRIVVWEMAKASPPA